MSHPLVDKISEKISLAKQGVDPINNCNEAISLCLSAGWTLPPITEGYASCLWLEGNARCILAGLGIDSIANLEKAISLYKESRKVFSVEECTPCYANSMLDEGIARCDLAGLGVDSIANLEEAVRLHEKSRKIFSQDSPNYAISMVNEGIVRLALARLGVSSVANLGEAKTRNGLVSARPTPNKTRKKPKRDEKQ